MPDAPKEISDAVMKKMDEMDLPTVEDLFIMVIAEGAAIFACPLNISLFEMTPSDLIDGVKVADSSEVLQRGGYSGGYESYFLEEELCENFHLLSFLLNIQNWL